MAFDITSVLQSVSGPDTEQIEYIDLDRIDPDPENFYLPTALDELAANIELIGLQQPLRVRPGTEAGRYTIVSGHRRRAAIMMIRDGGSDQFSRGVPCIVEYGDASETMRKLRLIYANASTRVMTAAEISKQAEETEMLLYRLKEEGVEFPGRMRDHVAEACRVSKSKLARLHAIRHKLDPGLLSYFDRGELNEEAAYQLSRLPEHIQAEAAARLENGKQKKLPIANVVEKVNRNLEKYQAEMPCRSHAGGPDCHHKDEKILRSIFAPYDWQVCDAGACCRDCYHWKDCSRACQECKDRRKLEKDVEAEKEAEREKDRKRTQEVRRTIYRKSCRRLLPLIEAAGLKDDEELPRFKWAAAGQKISKIREWAAGDFGDAYLNDDWGIVPDQAAALENWADRLGCTTDFLLERTDDPKPAAAAKWSTGTPAEPGEFVIRCGAPKEETPGSFMKTIQKWNGESWVDARGVPLRLNVYGWIRLPEV